MEASSRSSRPRQLLIGLDAAEWNLVYQWARDGKLPNLHRLIKRGIRAKLSTTAAQLPDTVWTSLYAGMNPAKFTKYFYVQYDARTMGLQHLPDDVIQCTPFWDYLSRAGVRVGVVDAPKFPLSRSLNGFQLTNWGAHATKTARASNPESLLTEIESRFGSHPVIECDFVEDNPADHQRLRERILYGVRLRGRVTRWLMQTQSWEVFFATFSEPHCIGHHFWHYMDPNYPRHPQTDSLGLADTIEQVYRSIDEEIGEILSLAGEETLCMVFSSHGMGPLYHASWHLPEMLGLLGYGRNNTGGVRAQISRNARINPWRNLKRFIPVAVQCRIKSMLPRALQDQIHFLSYTGCDCEAG